ncbi:MAG: hypothetical protein CMJ78_25615 [Planctomycetaceae bacterium]|nr:hypothetical protein [Planctomycetaceae bacterium]
MKITPQLVEQIVAEVTAQLSAAQKESETSPTNRDSATSTPTIEQKTQANIDFVRLDDNVVTRDSLAAALGKHQKVVFGPKTVLTPTAHDYIRQHKIQWSRCTTTSATTADWPRLQVLVVNPSHAIDRAAREVNASRNIANSAADAASEAISLICRSECDTVVVLAEAAEVVACLANRNRAIRSGVVNSVDDAKSQQKLLGINVLSVKASQKSYVEVRNILKAVQSGGMPTVPEGW